MRDERPADPGWWTELGIVVVSGVLAAALAWVTRPVIAADDAAISFRYAERLATGHGLTSNDGERVLGASSVLHTGLIAAVRWCAIPTTQAALALGVVGNRRLRRPGGPPGVPPGGDGRCRRECVSGRASTVRNKAMHPRRPGRGHSLLIGDEPRGGGLR